MFLFGQKPVFLFTGLRVGFIKLAPVKPSRVLRRHIFNVSRELFSGPIPNKKTATNDIRRSGRGVRKIKYINDPEYITADGHPVHNDAGLIIGS